MQDETLAAACIDVARARRAAGGRTALVLFLLCSACSANVLFAAQGPAGAESAVPVATSQEDAANIVRQTYGGRIVAVVEATLEAPGDESGKPLRGHRIRVDVDGRVKTVFVDASGRIHEDARSTPHDKPE